MSERFSPDEIRTVTERPVSVLPGWIAFVLNLALTAVSIWLFYTSVSKGPWEDPNLTGAVAAGILFTISLICWNGLFVVQPNQAEVLILFGRYMGSVKHDGWFFTNPLVTKKKISLRVHNFNSQQLKVNDADGNPIEIAAVVVWRVVDTARAIFDVEDYEEFVEVQSETAIRHLASQYPYDVGQRTGDDSEPSLRGSADIVAADLQKELQARLLLAGIEVIEARLSHLAYSPEIAHAMLQRQQASAVIAARHKIVEGAVSMVEMALDMLEENQTVALTPEKKADLVASLLVVLTSDRGTTPTIPLQ